jgi:phytoene desaturase
LGQSSFCSFIFIVYVGFDKKIENISHHALFLNMDFYDATGNQEPSFTLFSLTDKTAAEGMESGFSCSLAPGINDSEEHKRVL